MLRRLLLAAALLAPVAVPATAHAQSPAPAPAPTPAFDHAGRYTFTTMVQGGEVPFEMVIERKEDGTLTGKVLSTSFGEMPFVSLAAEGRTARGSLMSPGGEAAFEFAVAEDGTIEGKWALGADSAPLKGRKVS